MPDFVVSANALSVRFRRTVALEDAWFELPTGITAVIGPNGAGKTTLLRVLATLQSFEGGVQIGGNDLDTPFGRKNARTISGYLPQTVPFNRGFTVRETVGYAGWLKGLNGSTLGGAVHDALKAVNMSEHENRRASELSGGQRRRMGIAAGIVSKPRVLLLDEPTAGLDPVERRSLLSLLRELAQTTTVIYSTHLADEVAGTSHTVLVVNRGRVRWAGPLNGLVADQGGTATPAAVATAYGRLVEEATTP